MSQTITSYKGFDNELKCRGFQFEVGKEYEEPTVNVCRSGFHACKRPLDVFNYYPPANGTRYCVVEQSGKFSEDGENTKVASSKIKIGAEIGIPGLVKAQIEYVRNHCTNEHNAEPGKPATAGDSGAATSRGSVTVGKNGAGLVRGNNVKIRGGMGAILTIAEESDNNFYIKEWKSFVIDGETYFPDTWYILKNGEILKAD